MIENLIFTVFGTIAGLLLGLFIDQLREPRLEVTSDGIDPLIMGENAAKVLRLNLINKPLPRWISSRIQSYLSRRPATFCQGRISFHRLDGEAFFSNRLMPIRFTGSREPIYLRLYNYVDPNHKESQLWGFLEDEYIRQQPSTVDLIVGVPIGIDVAIRWTGDSDRNCYGFTNASYEHEHFKHPEWKLPSDNYLVRVQIFVQGHLACVRDFRLLNLSTTLQDFKLINAQPEDSKKINKRLTTFNN